jgi:hypothetical protein
MSSVTQTNICNLALRLLGVARITSISADKEQARILNDIYDMIQDEILSAHPWNFAIKRATLTALGGLITTWTASGTTNVWQAALTTEPRSVKFDGIEGTEKTSVAACVSAYDWYWESNVLYVYSTSDPDTAYTSNGIDAIIPEFEYRHAFTIPSDCLRLIRMEKSDANFVREGDMILTNEDEFKIQYIARITDTTMYTPAFNSAFAARLASEIAFPLTNSVPIAKDMYKLYLEKLKVAKGVDAQEGSAIKLEDLSWEQARE